MSFNIEARKVQQTGGSSYIISLPKEWITKHGIKAKDTIGVLSQPDGNLLITPYMSTEKHVIERNFDVDEIKDSDFFEVNCHGITFRGRSNPPIGLNEISSC